MCISFYKNSVHSVTSAESFSEWFSCMIAPFVGVAEWKKRVVRSVALRDSTFEQSDGVHLDSSGSWYFVSRLLHQASFFSGTSSFIWGVFGFRRKVLSQDFLSNIFS